jgi:hypothetical protein
MQPLSSEEQQLLLRLQQRAALSHESFPDLDGASSEWSLTSGHCWWYD